MFEVGKEYSFTLLSRDEGGVYEHTRTWEVSAVDGNLLHLLGPDLTGNPFLIDTEEGEEVGVHPRETMILNIGSAFFHSAQLANDD